MDDDGRATYRRRFLAACAALSAGGAGCLASRSDGPGGGAGSDDGDGAGDGGDRDGSGGHPGTVVDHETLQYGPPGAEGPWPDGARAPSGVAALADDEDRATAILDGDWLRDERREAIEAFVAATDFSTERLCYVETAGPNACYDEVQFSDVGTEAGRLVATAAIVDTSGADEACAQVETHTVAVLRVAFDGDPADEAAVTIVDGWGESNEVVVRVDDPIPGEDGSDGWFVRPDGDPPEVGPRLVCEDAAGDRHPPGYRDAAWGSAHALGPDADEDETVFQLRVDRLGVARGDAVTVRLENVSDENRITGNRHKYNVEQLTEDGWEDVRVATGDHPLGYTDEGVGHAPGEGFEWTFEFTEHGLVAGHAHEDHLRVCPDLEPGRYRFVFWEPAVAVAWDYPSP